MRLVELDGRRIASKGPLDGIGVVGSADADEDGDEAVALAEADDGELPGCKLDAEVLIYEVEECAGDAEEDGLGGGVPGAVEFVGEVGVVNGKVQGGGGGKGRRGRRRRRVMVWGIHGREDEEVAVEEEEKRMDGRREGWRFKWRAGLAEHELSRVASAGRCRGAQV